MPQIMAESPKEACKVLIGTKADLLPSDRKISKRDYKRLKNFDFDKTFKHLFQRKRKRKKKKKKKKEEDDYSWFFDDVELIMSGKNESDI